MSEQTQPHEEQNGEEASAAILEGGAEQGVGESKGEAVSSAGDESPGRQAEAGQAEPNLEDLLAEAKAERDRVREQLLRVAADFENFRKRSRKDVTQAEERAKAQVAREFLPIVDNLERAVNAGKATLDAKVVLDGVEMVLKSFEDIGQRLQIVRVKTEGERFDPAVHDAIQQLENDEVDPGTVIGEVVSGYRLGDKLLRAAMVVVAKAPSVSEAPSEDSGAGDTPSGGDGQAEQGADGNEADEALPSGDSTESA